MTPSPACRDEELYASSIAELLLGARHVAVGMLSPVAGCAALLAQSISTTPMRVSILGSRNFNRWTNGGAELFDIASRGRLDAFFLSGGQIDGQGNINLVGLGHYPQTHVRWSGSFGSAYLYYLVERVILFRWEHSRRTLVQKVDFVSSPGVSPAGIKRRGGPIALITNLCLFTFDQHRAEFSLKSIHPGHTLEEVQDQTGFSFSIPQHVPTTPVPDSARLHLLRDQVAPKVAEIYPAFAQKVFQQKDLR